MAYSINPELVEQRREEFDLDSLAQGAKRWKITPPDGPSTRRAVYRIREALYIAQMHPERFPLIAQAADKYSIHYIEPGVIEAKLKHSPSVETQGVATHGGGNLPWGKELATVGPTKADECIDAWQKHLPSSDPVNFPNTTLSDEELQQLWTWATRRNPRLMILVGAGTVTLSLRMAEMDTYAWSPPKPPAEPPKPDEAFDL